MSSGRHEHSISILEIAAHTAASNRRWAGAYGTTEQAESLALLESDYSTAIGVLRTDASTHAEHGKEEKTA